LKSLCWIFSLFHLLYCQKYSPKYSFILWLFISFISSVFRKYLCVFYVYRWTVVILLVCTFDIVGFGVLCLMLCRLCYVVSMRLCCVDDVMLMFCRWCSVDDVLSMMFCRWCCVDDVMLCRWGYVVSMMLCCVDDVVSTMLCTAYLSTTSYALSTSLQLCYALSTCLQLFVSIMFCNAYSIA
jgi:hypothetical protein